MNHVSLRDVRSYERLELALESGLVLVTGPNGAGKTNLLESVHLAIGLASWRNGGEEFLAPVLLRPLAIRRYGRDFELKLKGQPFLNPALAREVREQFQITHTTLQTTSERLLAIEDRRRATDEPG